MGVLDVPELVQTFERYWHEQGYAGIDRGHGWRKGLRDALSEERAQEHLALLGRQLGFPLAGKRLLDLGSGPGMFVAISRSAGVDAFGVEPDEGAMRAAILVMEHYGIGGSPVVQAVGERLPFADSQFDIVYSASVLEHVQDPAQVIREAVRVLKPGGSLYLKVPNFGSFWEGHYGIPWVPYIPRALAKLYVSILGKNPRFLNTLHLMTPGTIDKLLARHRHQLTVLDMGVGLWQERMTSLSFPEWGAAYRLRPLLRLARKLGLLGMIRVLGKRLRMHYPIIVIAKKAG